MCRRHENTGTGTTACLRRSTRCGAGEKGTSASGITPRRAGMPPVTAAILEKSTAPTTRHAKAWAKLMARVGEEFPLQCTFLRRRYSAHLLDTQADVQAAGRSRLTSNWRFARVRRPGWLRTLEARFSCILASRSNLLRFLPLAGHRPTEANSSRCITTYSSSRSRPTLLPAIDIHSL